MAGNCKVDRIGEKYGLDGLDGRLERRRSQKDASLRQLESHINREVLKRAMTSAGKDPIKGEAANLLDHLRGDDEISRKEARRELRRQGIDVNELEEDFVSYQTVRKHLNECMQIDTSSAYSPAPDEDRRRLGDLKGRAEKVIKRTFDRLRKHDAIKVGEPRPAVSLKVKCGDCGRTHDASELLRTRRCACADDEPERAATTAPTKSGDSVR